MRVAGSVGLGADEGLIRGDLREARGSDVAYRCGAVVVTVRRPPGRTRDICWIYLHMIQEHARHNGRADLIRERIEAPLATDTNVGIQRMLAALRSWQVQKSFHKSGGLAQAA